MTFGGAVGFGCQHASSQKNCSIPLQFLHCLFCDSNYPRYAENSYGDFNFKFYISFNFLQFTGMLGLSVC